MESGNWIRVIPLLMASIPLQTPNRSSRMPGSLWHVRCIRLCCNTAIFPLRWHRSCRSWSSNLLCTPASNTLSCPMCPCIVEAIVHLADTPTYQCPGGMRWVSNMPTMTRSGTPKTLRKTLVKSARWDLSFLRLNDAEVEIDDLHSLAQLQVATSRPQP